MGGLNNFLYKLFFLEKNTVETNNIIQVGINRFIVSFLLSGRDHLLQNILLNNNASGLFIVFLMVVTLEI